MRTPPPQFHRLLPPPFKTSWGRPQPHFHHLQNQPPHPQLHHLQNNPHSPTPSFTTSKPPQELREPFSRPAKGGRGGGPMPPDPRDGVVRRGKTLPSCPVGPCFPLFWGGRAPRQTPTPNGQVDVETNLVVPPNLEKVL